MALTDKKRRLVKQAIAPIIPALALTAASEPVVELAHGYEPGELARRFGEWSAKPVHDHEGWTLRKHWPFNASDFPEPGPRAIIRNDGSEMLWNPKKDKTPPKREKIYTRPSSNRERLHSRLRQVDDYGTRLEDAEKRLETKNIETRKPKTTPGSSIDSWLNALSGTVKSHPMASIAGTALASYIIYKILNDRDRYY